ncbi:MAG TPA: hypothetical protein ENH84_02225 [Phycisphaerae bacterium]|nr:hypothetical protein [Phycisphaerae bacterium]
MPILVMCVNSECCELFHVADEVAGKKVRCPQCGTIQTAPEAPVSTPPAASDSTVSTPRAPSTLPEQEGDLEAIETEEFQIAPLETPPSSPPPEQMLPADHPAELPELIESELDDEKDSSSTSTPPVPWTLPETLSTDAGQVAPEKNETLNDEQDDLFTFPEKDTTAPSIVSEPLGDSIPEFRRMTAVIFAVGLLGITAGLLVGVRFFPYSSHILNAYLGGGMGWVGGFIITFLLIVAHQGSSDKVRCHICGSLYGADRETCGLCGTILSGEYRSPLTSNCLRAGAYAISDKINILVLVWPLAAGGGLFALTLYLFATYYSELKTWKPLFIGLNVLIGFLLFSYWLRFLTHAMSATRTRDENVPSPPPFWSLENCIFGAKVLGVLGVYVLPLFTLPLLPLGLLILGISNSANPFHLGRSIRAVSRNTRDISVLWMFLLLWGSGMFLCVAVLTVVLYFAGGWGAPFRDGSGWTVLTITLSVAAFGVVCYVFGLAMFRCIGLFGRYYPYAFRDMTSTPAPGPHAKK